MSNKPKEPGEDPIDTVTSALAMALSDADLGNSDIPDVSTMIGSELTINEALPGLVRGEATALLLDSNNLFMRAKDNDFRIDYGRLMTIFAQRCDLRHCCAFGIVDRNNPSSINWITYMNKQGYTTVTKDLQRYMSADDKLVTKGNMDVEITIAAMNLSQSFSHIVIGTCDGDFVPLIDELRKGNFRKVSVLGIRNSNWTGISKSLIRSADNFYDLMAIKDIISYHGNKSE